MPVPIRKAERESSTRFAFVKRHLKNDAAWERRCQNKGQGDSALVRQ
jgi:hypothetical protein